MLHENSLSHMRGLDSSKMYLKDGMLFLCPTNTTATTANIDLGEGEGICLPKGMCFILSVGKKLHLGGNISV